MNSAVIELLAPRYDIAWYPWAVQYFFLIALSYASLWLAAPALVLGKKTWLPVARLAMLAAVSTTLVAPVALLADLHQPLRFWHFYAYFTTSSWMSIGSLILPLYVLAVLALGWLSWRPALQQQRSSPGLGGWLARILSFGEGATPRAAVAAVGIAALVLSTGIMLYTGAEIAIVKARPLWNTVWLPPMFVATGFIAASGLVMVFNRFSGMREPVVNAHMLKVLLGSAIVAGLIATLWLSDGLNENFGSVNTALEAVRYNPEWRATALWGGVAGVLLFAATLFALLRPGVRPHAWVIGLFALHVAWMFRWVVLMDVQTIARHSAGFHHYGIPAGSYGLLGIIGTFGLWLAVVLVIDMFMPWRDARPGNGAAQAGARIESNAAQQGVPSHG